MSKKIKTAGEKLVFNFEFGKKNFLILFTAFAVLITGFVLMSVDKTEYGYGFLGLTLGPVFVMTGLIIPVFSIFSSNLGVLKEKIKDPHTITGWFLFVIALAVYTYTVEPTVSFWDCGEFIACSYKLEIPHPPGAPLFLLIGRMFSFFASGRESVAFCVNMVSAVASAFTVSFLYWSIVMLLRQFNKPGNNQTLKTVLVAAAGALTFAFTDSCWFNAAEAEVYALSCFFTSISFWAILKWNKDGQDKWLYFTFYLVGLSFGVHLLNLLTLPALAMVYYFKRYNTSAKGIVFALLVSAAIILFLMEGIITGLPSVAEFFEIKTVNWFHLPFGSGLILFLLLIIGAMIYLYRFSIRTNKSWLRFSLSVFILVLTGYSSYMIVAIRSGYNPPIDENNPENILNMVSYLKREQYGSRPLLKGPYFTAGYPVKVEKTKARYHANYITGQYEISDHDMEYKYDPAHEGYFPRMYSTDKNHVSAYRKWMNLQEGEIPTVADNLKFMFTYQVGHMYWRYFLWNFAGRAGDDQNSNWIPVNEWAKNDLPETIRDNKWRNNLFCLPLLFGVIGMIFHFRKQRKYFFILLLMFFFTGIAIVIYLNQPPVEPRERDYTFVGSFYTFCIWISLGFFAVIQFIEKRISRLAVVPAFASLLLPVFVFSVNFDDHNRNGRTFARDSARNLLRGCAPNAILFCAADNDTFPLWYVQEVEGFRTDVRVCNLSLLHSDWYIESMKKKANESDPLPVSMSERSYRKGRNEQVVMFPPKEGSKEFELKTYFQLLDKEDPSVFYTIPGEDALPVIPGSSVYVNVDTGIVIAQIPAGLKANALKKLSFTPSRNILKSELAVLDIIAHNNWKRPIYFDQTAILDFSFLKPFLQDEGNAFRLFPVKINGQEQGWVNADLAYKNLVKEAEWYSSSNVDVPQDNAAMPFVYSTRVEHYKLALQLLHEGDKVRVKETILHCLKMLPDSTYSYDNVVLSMAELLFKVNSSNEAIEICKVIEARGREMIAYYERNDLMDGQDYRYQGFLLEQATSLLNSAGVRVQS